MSDDFFPEIPDSASRYMKLEKGKANKFRILGKPIDGYEYWVALEEGKKPVRKPKDVTISPEELSGAPEDKPRYFWALPVYNYESSQIQILQLTQKSIQRAIKEYSAHEDYGTPTGYDLTIKREGDGFDTEYSVIASPPKPLDDEIKELYKNTHIDLSKLYSSKENKYGGDPFEVKEKGDLSEEELDQLNATVDEE